MKIPFRGIVKNTPAGLAQDGELEDVLNLRYKDGAWRPIPDRSAIFSALPYTNVYIHSNSGYTHYLGVKTTSAHDNVYDYIGAWSSGTTYTVNQAVLYNSAYYYLNNGTTIGTPPVYGNWVKLPDSAQVVNGTITIHVDEVTELYFFAKDIDNVPKEITPVLIYQVGKLATFTQIGNVINILDGGLKYLIWYENAYVLIDSNFDGEQDSTIVGPVKVDLKVDADVNAESKIKLRTFQTDNTFATNTNIADRKEAALSLFKKARGINRRDGLIQDFFIACTAIELYDGTYVLHSNPVLMGQSYDVGARYNFNFGGQQLDYLTNKPVFSTYQGELERTDVNTDGFYEETAYNVYDDYVSEPDIYEGLFCWLVGEGMSAVTTMNFPNYSSFWWGMPTAKRIKVPTVSNRFKFKINSAIDDKFKPLIKSISVFISPEVCMYDFTSASSSTHTNNYVVESYHPKIKTNAEILKELSELRTFYKVHEIPFEDIKTTTDNDGWVTIDLKGKLGDSLLTQEALPYDDFSHHSTLPQVAMTYNSKLHVANYKTILSRGWPASHMFAHQGIGQFPAPISTYNDLFCYIEVSIKTTNGLSKVVRYANYSEFGQFGMISYPDARATNIVIYVYAEIVFGTLIKVAKKLEYKLTPSVTCNFAYYINPDLKPISIAGDVVTSSETAPAEVQREQVYQNAMKVSEVNNPFTFPVQNTYQVGNGSITGIASNTIALSTGQFGEYPLYVFTTDGIWAMYVGGAEVNYTSSRPVSREVCNNPKSIKAIDTGVVFSTAKGIMVIAGSSTKELSEPIEGAVFDIDKLSLFKKALNHDKLTTLLSEVTGEDIHDYIASANVGYNYIESEIWFTNPLKSYSYVFSKGLWYKVKQTGNRFVDDYPKQYLLTSTGDLVDIASEVLITGSEGKERAASQQIMLLTRPLKFGDVEFKQMLTAIMRGQLTTVNLIEEATPTDILHKKWAGIHVYGSYDGERWVFLGGAEKQGELNDIGTRIERTDCRYYRIALYGNVSLNSYINYLEMEGKQSILRTKLR